MATSPIDYAALAKKHGGTSTAKGAVDYAALAAKHGGSSDDTPTSPATPSASPSGGTSSTSRPDVLDKMRQNLDSNTRDLRPTGGFFHDKIVAPAVHVANRIGQNIAGTALDLITVKPFDEQMSDAEAKLRASEDDFKEHPVSAVVEGAANEAPMLPGIGTQIRGYANSDHPVGDIVGDVATAGILGKVAKGPEELGGGRTAEKLRTGAQTVVGAGARSVSAAVKSAAEAAEREAVATGEANRAATESTLRKRGAVDKANADGQAQVDARNEAGRQKVTDSNLKQLEKEGNDRLEVLRKNRASTKDYAIKVEQVKAENERVLNSARARQKAEGDLATASNILDRKYQAAEKKATGLNNVAWDVVRDKTKDAKGDIGALKQTVEAAAKNADPASSPIFRSILQEDSPTARPVIVDGKFVSPDDANYDRYYEVQYGEPVPLSSGRASFSRLQRWYSYVNDRLYGSARLEAGAYNALKMVRQGLNDAMQSIADKTGATKELAYARNLHTAKMETFANSPNQTPTVASKSFAEQSPEYAKEQARKDRLAKVARYDPTIPMIARHVENLRGALKAIPAPRDFGQLPQRPDPLAKPKPGPLSEYSPATFTPKEYGEPAATKPIEIPELNTRKMREDFINAKLASWTNVSRFQLGRLVTGPLGTLVAAATGHELYGAAGAVYSIAEASPFVLQRLLDKPGLRDWLTRPPAGELDTLKKLPHADRLKIMDGMNGVLREAARQQKPIKIAPAVAAFLAGSTLPATQRHRDLEAIRDRYTAQMQRPGSSRAQ